MTYESVLVYFTAPAYMDGALDTATELMENGFLVFNALSHSSTTRRPYGPGDGFDWLEYRRLMSIRCDVIVSYATSLGYDEGWEEDVFAAADEHGVPIVHLEPSDTGDMSNMVDRILAAATEPRIR